MDENRKRAYAYLLYQAMLEIRGWSNSYAEFYWNPFKWKFLRKGLKRCNELSDAFHNLAKYLSIGMEAFNEDWFWERIQQAKQNEGTLFDYRSIFDEELMRLTNSQF